MIAILLMLIVGLATLAHAAPNVANAAQKGSLLVFPDVRVDDTWNTLIRLQNDGTSNVDLKCAWMDGNKNRVMFTMRITRSQALWFDARSGRGTFRVNRFPASVANGFDNPFLVGPGGLTEDTDTAGPFLRGLLACWAVDNGSQNQVKWNHLSGTATVYDPALGAYEYSAYAFFVPTGLDLVPVGPAGILNLNGVEYDACPLYHIGQFSPTDADGTAVRPQIEGNRLALSSCNFALAQDWLPTWTKWQFDVWNSDEVKFSGAYECANGWHETTFGEDIDAARQNFAVGNLGTYAARYRVQGVRSTQCEAPGRLTQGVGVLAVHSSWLTINGVTTVVGSTLVAAGKFTGRVQWDPSGPVPEGRIR